uniref:C3/C5 convertase n=1 Tax=Esox lucius TaxID=8010 RepID=A0A3P8Z845_ESOLU
NFYSYGAIHNLSLVLHTVMCKTYSFTDLTGVGVLCETLCNDKNLDIEGGYYTLSNGHFYGSMLVYHCPEGYYAYPALTRSCQKSGAWSPGPKRRSTQRCRMIECPNPLVLESGSVFPVQAQYFVNNETTYECYSGYTLRGSSSRKCQPNGKWSGGTPICIRDGDRCADPGTPPGARRTGDFFGIGDGVTYRCDDGLTLVGSKERVCQENGQWTGTEPKCYYKHTYDTPLEITEAFGSAIRESLLVSETNNDTDLVGKKIHVEKGGLLNIYIAMDISDSINEEEFQKARNAVIKLITKVSSFSVSPNYEILFFASDIKEIVNIIDFSGENRKTLDNILTELKNFQYDARENVGTNLNLAFKTILESMAIQKQRNETLFEQLYHVLIFFTDGAYNMGGRPEETVAKINEMVIMNKKDERDKNLDIYIFGVGSDIYDEDITPLVTKRDGETHYFKVKSGDELDKTFDEIIDEANVVGLCGLHRNYDKGTPDSQRLRYPWLARIEVTREGGQGKCMGSLVTPEYILTAAHCFKFEDTVDKIKVKTIKNIKVKSLILHPKYNLKAKAAEGLNEFYDYDVALLKLTKSVDVSIDTRPICIPCTKETSAALKLVGEKITCKQHEELLLHKTYEEASFMSYDKFEQFEQENQVKLKLKDQVKNITANNLEKVVTANFLCSGGRDPTRDNIACKGDSGGAVFKNYDDYRTIQVGVISWGSKNLCPERVSQKQESTDESRDFHINLFKVVPFLKEHLGDDSSETAPLTFLDG